MKSEIIIILDIKLNWQFIVENAEEKIANRQFIFGNTEEKNTNCYSLLESAELKNANLANIRIL